MSGFLYLQVGIFPFWLYTPLPGDVSVTPVTWRCPAPPAVRLESSRYLLICASLWLCFHLFEQEEVTRRYAGHVGAWNTAMLCLIMKFWTDRAERTGALCWHCSWCWVRQLFVRFPLTFPVIVKRKPSVLVKVLTQFSHIFFSLMSRYPTRTIETFSQNSATSETWIAFIVWGINSMRHH